MRHVALCCLCVILLSVLWSVSREVRAGNFTIGASGDTVTFQPSVTALGKLEYAEVDTLKFLQIFLTSIDTVTCVGDSGDASLATMMTVIISDGGNDDNPDTVDLADGTAGQIKFFSFKTNTDGADTVEVHCTLPGGAGSIVFTSVEHGCTLMFDGASWNIVGEYGIGVP